jgi:hypothetical protein
MTKLKQSKYFAKVELKKTAAVGGGKSERLVNFEITAAARYSPLAADAAEAPPGKKG